MGVRKTGNLASIGRLIAREARSKPKVNRHKERLWYLRNGKFYYRFPEKTWVIDKGLATEIADWQRPLFRVGMPSTVRWQRILVPARTPS